MRLLQDPWSNKLYIELRNRLNPRRPSYSKHDRRSFQTLGSAVLVHCPRDMAHRHPHVQGNPANTGVDKICRPNDGHKHLMYRVKSPYAGGHGLRLPLCNGCGLADQSNWYECIHCTKKRCQQCRVRPKESSTTTEFVSGSPPSSLPPPDYPGR